MRAVAALALLACVGLAQEKAPLPFDAVLVKPAELPKTVKLVDGMHCVSPQAKTYFETPALKDIMKTLAPEVAAKVSEETLDQFPVPKRKECQSFQAQGRPAGSVLVFEYAEDADETLAFLRPYIWGERRSEKHPEEFVVHGRHLWVLSFPYPAGDPAAEWYKDRLRKKFRVPAPRERPDLAALRGQVVKAFEAKDAAAGIKLLQPNAKAADWSLGQNMHGQFAEMKKDHALAEKAYRKALQLHDTIADPLDPRLLWVTLDGLAIALHAQGKRPEAVKLLARALEAATECEDGVRQARAQSHYNLACVHAMMKKYEDAAHALDEAIRGDPSYVETARKDPDFAEALKLKEFQAVLAEAEARGKAKGPLTLDAVLVKPDELPANVRAIEGIHTPQPHPRDFYETPSVEGMSKILPPQLRSMLDKEYMESFPLPKRKAHQSFHADGGTEGTVFVFEYETDDLSIVIHFLEPILWGRTGPSEEHPEELVVHGRFLWIISFQPDDPAREWYKDRLRKKLRVPAPRSRPDLEDTLGVKLMDFLEQRDADGALKFLADNAAAVESWSFGQFMLGQFALAKRDGMLAEKGFRKAIALHESLEDPLTPEFFWAVIDGLGTALAGQGKWEQAARAFERAIAVGNELKDPTASTKSCYHIAVAIAAMQQWDHALRALTQVISVDKKYKEIAREDPALAEARKRPEFQELLK
ncbi:MAG: TPR end-of-group domain-containing protein [Planctomycetota bacterium]